MTLKILISASALIALVACSESSTGTSIEDTVKMVEPDIKKQTEQNESVASVSVRVGQDGPDLDACAGYGVIKGLNPQGDNFLSVRSAPDGSARELDRLSQGAGVAMCDFKEGWVGVVYAPSQNADADCGTGSPVAKEQDYEGPCRSGWVSERFVELMAG